MRRLAVLLTLLLALGASAGCGGGEEATPTPETVEGTVPGAEEPAKGDADAGEKIFAAQGCGGCHIFAAAGSSGTIGPNLDESDADFAGAVKQITNGGGGMPAFKDKLSDEEIANVAAYVIERRSG